MLTSDKMLVCRDCKKQFAFTASEQEFYSQMGLRSDPGRCRDCREARKARNGGSASSAPRSSGYAASDSRPQRAMHTVTCNDCGGVAQVPFIPSNDRPVYCRDCYAKRRG